MGNSPAQNPTSTFRGYPLPVGQNYLSDDVVRLATALSSIDGDINAASTKLLAIRSVTSSYAVKVSDLTFLVDYAGNSAADVITLPAPASVTAGFNLRVRNSSTVGITLTPAGGAAINGQATYALQASTTIAVVSDGTTWKVLSVAQVSAGSLTASGAQSTPSHSFTADPTVGLYLPATGQGALAAGGVTAMVWSATGILVGGAAGGFQGAGTINAAKVFYAGQDLIARNDGSSASPTYSFAGETSIGAYRAGSGQYAIAVAGVQQFVFTATGLRGTGATAVTGTQLAGSANVTELYVNGTALSSSLAFGPSGVAVSGVTGGVKGAGTVNASDYYVKGSSLGALLGLNGSVGGALNLTDIQLNGASLASSISFGATGVALAGAVGGQQGAGSLNVGSLYINGVVLNPGLITPTLPNALGYLRINAAGTGVEYRSPQQLLNDLGVQTALGYVPVNRNGDTMAALVVQGTLQVGAAATFTSALTVQNVASVNSLAVTTSAAITGALVVTGVTTLQAASATSLTVNGSLGITGASTLAALTATTGRLTGNLTVLGATALASLGAGPASFTGAVGMSSTLGVAGTVTAGRLAVSGLTTLTGAATLAGGVTIAGGGLAMAVGQGFSTTDSVAGFQFQSGALASTASATQVLGQFMSSMGTGTQSLRVWQKRSAAGGSDWTSTVTRLQMLNGTTNQGYIEWGPAVSGAGGLKIGAVDNNGADQSMLQIDPLAGLTVAANVSLNAFLGVGGGAQLNGGVAMQGGVSVDTLTGSGAWSTAGNITCKYITQLSDERLKRDFGGIDPMYARRFLLEAKPVSYRWRGGEVASGRDADSRHYGYRAQELEQAGLGDLIHSAPRPDLPDARSMDYVSTIALLHVALRSAAQEIEYLSRRMSRLEANRS